MRSLGSIDALFPHARRQILSTLVPDPDRAWYLSELAQFHRTAPSSLQRELASLVRAGILTKSRDGNRTYYRADAKCPVFPALQGLLGKTAGWVAQAREAFRPLSDTVRVAFAFGAAAVDPEQSSSDIDLLVVGSTGFANISHALDEVERRIDRSIHHSFYSELEFRLKFNLGTHSLTTIVEGPKFFLVGSDADLTAIAGPGRVRTHLAH